MIRKIIKKSKSKRIHKSLSEKDDIKGKQAREEPKEAAAHTNGNHSPEEPATPPPNDGGTGFALSPEEEQMYMEQLEESMNIHGIESDCDSADDINVADTATDHYDEARKLDQSMEEAKNWMHEVEDFIGGGDRVVVTDTGSTDDGSHDIATFDTSLKDDVLSDDKHSSFLNKIPLPKEISLVHTFEDKSHSVCSVAAFDDDIIVSGHNDGSIKGWSLFTRGCIRTFKGHSDSIFSIAVVNDNQILSGSDDKLIKLWDFTTEECIHTFWGHTKRVTSVAVVGSRRFTSGSDDRTIKLWDMMTGKCIRSFNHGFSESVYAVAALDSYNMGSDGNIIRVWNSETGKCVKKMEHHSVFSLAAVGSGQFLSCALDKTIKLWEAETGHCVHTFQGHSCGVWSVAAIDNNNKFVSSDGEGNIKLWNLALKEETCTFLAHTGVATSVAAMRQQRFISGSMDKTIKVWKLLDTE